ncbi:unnamed protein product [Linum trigynum]|uniref:Transcription elongation factor 1 homolog n=1 Tax=Linum trigynum TaxID=586398 RepID=A0AAV2FG39_9ROSI
MGKRKSSSSKKLLAKKPKHAQKLEKVFNCPFCGYVDCVDCHLDNEIWIATLRCNRCGESYTTRMNRLTEPIDVFAEWIDECQLVNPDDPAAVTGANNHHRGGRDSSVYTSRPTKIATHQPPRRSCQVV